MNPRNNTASTTQAPPPLAASWMLERARVLHGICLRIDRQHEAQGVPLRRAFNQAAKRLQGRCYRCDKGRSLALSAASLRRIYYRWSQARSVECLVLGYRATSRASLKPATVRQFLRFAVQAGVWSFLTAYGLLMARGKTQGRKLPSYATLLRAIPAKVRARITAEHKRRRRAHQAEQVFAAYARQLARKGGK